jgi:heat-inducible transcriptional repressor
MDFNERKKRILQIIVEDFILTNTPVGSRTISKNGGLGVSSATIRNEMADLEEMGYLLQPHVSAGRIPSDKAYRLYVDALLAPGLRDDERESVRRYFTSRVHDMEDVISLCAQTLSDLTHYAALVMTPRQSDLRVSSLHLVGVARGSALLIVVTDSGVIRDTTIRVSEKLDSDGLYAISKMLTERLRGLSLRQMREMLYGFAAHSDADARVLSGIAELAGQMEKQTETDRVMVGGAHNILYYPEYADVSRARAFMDALEKRDALITLMRPPQGTISVRIGSEIGMAELSDCSVITAPYRVGRGHVGTIGVVGPMRMNYARVMDTLSIVAHELTGMLSVDALEA